MKIEKAIETEVKEITALVQKSIEEQYPSYYPVGAVGYFLSYHTEEKIRQAVINGEVYNLREDNELVGTGGIKDNQICRLFVKQKSQGKGYGSALMDFLEETLFKNYPCVELDASLKACEFYRKRGYETVEYKKLKAPNGDYLCYPVMKKEKKW